MVAIVRFLCVCVVFGLFFVIFVCVWRVACGACVVDRCSVLAVSVVCVSFRVIRLCVLVCGVVCWCLLGVCRMLLVVWRCVDWRVFVLIVRVVCFFVCSTLWSGVCR